MGVESWADVATLFAHGPSLDDTAAGWTDALWTRFRFMATQSAADDMRFLPAEALSMVRYLNSVGVTSGPTVDAIAGATRGVPGVATPEAVGLAVRSTVVGLRRLGFKGRSPTLSREVDGGTLHVVNLQRINAGVTGREPGFTVNLNLIHGPVRRALAEVQRTTGARPAVSFGYCMDTRLGQIALGEDRWWRPSNTVEAGTAAQEVLELMGTYGLAWFERFTDPDAALADLLARRRPLPPLVVAAALLVERPSDRRIPQVEADLRAAAQRFATSAHPDDSTPVGQASGETSRLVEWLIAHLTPPAAPG